MTVPDHGLSVNAGRPRYRDATGPGSWRLGGKLGWFLFWGRARFLSLDFWIRAFSNQGDEARLRAFRKFVYQVGSIPSDKGAWVDEEVFQSKERKNFELTAMDRFRYRTRYFTDSGVIGTGEAV